MVLLGLGLANLEYVLMQEALSVTISTLLDWGTVRIASIITANSALLDDGQSVTPVVKKLFWFGPFV